MKVSHADHDYFEIYKDPLGKYLCVFQHKFCAYCYQFYDYHEIYFYVFNILKEKKNQNLAF